jgi:phosphatidylinositol alpha-1,6-mannosyltransferase
VPGAGSRDPSPPRSGRPIAELVHISANLREDGGGAAHFGRVLGRAARRYASRCGLRFRGLHLPAPDGGAVLDGYTSYGGNPAALAAEAVWLNGSGASSRALLFDHPGPARIQGWMPPALRAPHGVAILGVDVWRPLPADRARALRSARAVVAISRTTMIRADPYLPMGCRLDCVHPGIEPVDDSGSPDDALLGALPPGYTLVVGRLDAAERYKGHDELLAAWSRLPRQLADAHLVVAGGGSDRSRLEARASALGLEQRVTFTGAVDPATRRALYAGAALFAMPSRDEGFGLVFVEAMAAGLPCLALAGTAPAEIVVHEETGLLVPEGDEAALVAALSRLLEGGERTLRMGAAGRARYEREFTEAAFERRIEPVLARLTRRAD